MNVLDEANRLVHGARNAEYGHPFDDFSRTALIWTAILSAKLKRGAMIEPEEVGLCMCAVKISRQCNKPNDDNLVDLAGYAETVNMVVKERARRKHQPTVDKTERYLNYGGTD